MAKRKKWFRLTELHRDDIVQAFADIDYEVDASQVTDDQMKEIAEIMVEAWLEGGLYWQSLRDAFDQVVRQQEDQVIKV